MILILSVASDFYALSELLCYFCKCIPKILRISLSVLIHLDGHKENKVIKQLDALQGK